MASSPRRCWSRVTKRRIVLHVLARRHHFRLRDEVHRVAMGLRVGRDLVHQRRPARRHVGVDERGEAMPLAGARAGTGPARIPDCRDRRPVR